MGARILVVVAHPVIAQGLETLLRLDGEHEVRRVVSLAEAMKQREWTQVAFVDGTLLTGSGDFRIGAPAYVLSGSERDGRQLARKLDDGRGWLRKDATGAELAAAIRSAVDGEQSRGGISAIWIVVIALACLVTLALVAYLVLLALY